MVMNISKFLQRGKPACIEFDPHFYLEKYPDIGAVAVARSHWKIHGWREGRWPHPYFDTKYYVESGQFDTKSGLDPLSYFLKNGRKKKHSPIPFFDPEWYIANYDDVRAEGLDPLEHFVLFGDLEGRKPSASFNAAAYTRYLSQLGLNSERPFRYFLHHGIKQEGHREIAFSKDEVLSFKELAIKAGEFDGNWYLNTYADVRLANWNPLEHFTMHGAAEFRNPNSSFESDYYAEKHPDYIETCASPYEHYLRFAVPAGEVMPTDAYMRWAERFDSLKYVEKAKAHHSTIELPHAIVVHWFDAHAWARKDEIFAGWKSSIFQDFEIVIILASELKCSEKKEISISAEKYSNLIVLEQDKAIAKLVEETTYALICFGGMELNPLSLYMFLEAAERTGAKALYGDNDAMDEFRTRGAPEFKPTYSKYFLLNHNYIGRSFMVKLADLDDGERKTLFAAVSAGEAGRAVNLCFIEKPWKVTNIPFILSHNYTNSGWCGLNAKRESTAALTEPYPTVDIIIPMRDKVEFTRPCVESILSYTKYKGDFRIIIVDNASVEDATKAFLALIKEHERVSIIDYAFPFNFSAINNFAAAKSRADIVVFLNNDTKLIDPEWLDKMVRYCWQPDVGVVGAKLLYADDTIQHGGCVVGAAGGLVEHLLAGKNHKEVVDKDVTREMTVSTGACIAMRRSVFAECQGFDEILRVAWNDVKLCLTAHRKGYRNIYIADALFYHFESKSRGFDDSAVKAATFLREAIYVRRAFPEYFINDPSYSPNLSLESAGQCAVPPRVKRPWIATGQSRRILMLSIIHNIGYGVPVVMQLQAAKLVERGWDVLIGGPKGQNELSYVGSTRVYFKTARQAAAYAFDNEVDLVVAHTPPFFGVTDYLSDHIPVLFYDYGEPNPDFFPEPVKTYLAGVWRQKKLCSPLASKVATISQAIKSESLNGSAEVIGLGNSHLAIWSDGFREKRARLRKLRGWNDKFVVLNVCRFAATERHYKGIDKYAEVMTEFPFWRSELSSQVVWALVGGATPEDVAEMTALGFHVEANVSNDELVDLYIAADAYMSFSKWEGYNLGIGQALAMGLPVAASSIEAHREFPIFTTNSTLDVMDWLADTISAQRSGNLQREPTVFPWQKSVSAFSDLAEKIILSRRSG